jgi:hypothetical protein
VQNIQKVLTCPSARNEKTHLGISHAMECAKRYARIRLVARFEQILENKKSRFFAGQSNTKVAVIAAS